MQVFKTDDCQQPFIGFLYGVYILPGWNVYFTLVKRGGPPR